MSEHRINVLVVGQTPPPLNGQSVMIQELVDGRYDGIALHHVPMSFSRTTDEVGVFRFRKILVLLNTLQAVLVGRWQSRAKVLYYPPAGPTLNPVIRDMFLLTCTRWLFKYTVFHFHAAGLLEIVPHLPFGLKPLFKLAYHRPDLAIFTTESTAAAGTALGARIITVIPNGIPDNANRILVDGSREPGAVPRILFMGILCEGKGLLTLIEACSQLKKMGIVFELVCAGAFESEKFRKCVIEVIKRLDLTGAISFPGVLAGENKIRAFREAAIFCFPSYHYAESFGIVLVEAMSFGLPVVTTRWRGIPDVIGQSEGAFIVEPKRPDLVAEKLVTLVRDSELRSAMGKRNREWFCANYTVDKYRSRMERALLELQLQ
ncbi:MAG: glycosyltransferase family 4 protein [Terracidiphilus sp.]